jgi:hypothetical protein
MRQRGNAAVTVLRAAQSEHQLRVSADRRRVPTRVTSRASLRLFGVSTLEMTYEYEEINGEPVTHLVSGLAR